MVHIEEGGQPANVPLVYYDGNGKRHIIGEATVALRQGQLRVVGAFNDIPGALDFGETAMGHYSIGSEPDVQRGGPPPEPPSDAQIGGAFKRYMEGRLNDKP